MPNVYRIDGSYPFSVPNGLWVAQASSYSRTQIFDDEPPWPAFRDHRSAEIVGPEPAVFVLESYHESDGFGLTFSGSEKLLVGTEPFGMVIINTREGNGRYFVSARQIHKGELGQQMPVQVPHFVVEKKFRKGERPRRWVNLAELAKLAEMPVQELIQRYFDFTDMHEPRLHLRLGLAGTIAHPTEAIWLVKSPENLPHVGYDLQWARAGWATAVLRMVNLGYVPQGSFQPTVAA